ncbi:MAG TPA: aldehyde dehydrogenase family protein [Candidatus Nanoarchaeia archaeon]|nr:aldehyde dehydrogenase family protein [Candidatus Nanoarchaeia archaeon]
MFSHTYQNFINGEWVTSRSKKTFTSINPANEKVLGKFQASNFYDIEQAVQAAINARTAWKNVPAPERAYYLYTIKELLTKHKQRLGKLVATEMGKVMNEALGDVQEAIDIFEYMAGEGRRMYGKTTPSELRNKICYTQRKPHGIAGIITPWNFPIAIPAWKMAPALITGNTIVWKPSSDTPLCALELVELIHEAGIPKGVINLVTGSGKETGMPLVQHPKIDVVSFTGHRDTGKTILQTAGIKKVGLEMGGKNAIIVMDDADIDLAVDGILWGGYGTTGQRCTATSRIIAHQTIAKELEEKLLIRIKKLRLGPGTKETTDIGPLINKAAQTKTAEYTHLGKEEGATLTYGGNIPQGKGYYYQPTLFTNVQPNMRIAQEEIFGPVVALITVKDLPEAITVCNAIDYGLSAAVYTHNINHAFQALQHLETGIVYVNAPTIGAEVHLPFGGTKQTGWGREAGWTGIEEFSEEQTIYIDYSGKLQKAQGID